MSDIQVASPRYSVRRGGWRIVRPIPVPPVSIEQEALAAIRQDLAGAPEDCLRFFETVLTGDRRYHSIRAVAWTLAIKQSTLSSRFHRAGLPSPRTYLRYAAYLRLARMLEDQSVSFVSASLVLEAASSQTLHRPLRRTLGLTAEQFRRAYNGARMLERFRADLILPYRETLLAFRPLTVDPRDCAVRRASANPNKQPTRMQRAS